MSTNEFPSYVESALERAEYAWDRAFYMSQDKGPYMEGFLSVLSAADLLRWCASTHTARPSKGLAWVMTHASPGFRANLAFLPLRGDEGKACFDLLTQIKARMSSMGFKKEDVILFWAEVMWTLSVGDSFPHTLMWRKFKFGSSPKVSIFLQWKENGVDFNLTTRPCGPREPRVNWASWDPFSGKATTFKPCPMNEARLEDNLGNAPLGIPQWARK